MVFQRQTEQKCSQPFWSGRWRRCRRTTDSGRVYRRTACLDQCESRSCESDIATRWCSPSHRYDTTYLPLYHDSTHTYITYTHTYRHTHTYTDTHKQCDSTYTHTDTHTYTDTHKQHDSSTLSIYHNTSQQSVRVQNNDSLSLSLSLRFNGHISRWT